MTIAVKYTAHVHLGESKRKEFENYFFYGNLNIFNACDQLTGTLVVEQTEM